MIQSSEQNGIVLVPHAQHILDALSGPVAVVDQAGTIIAVNQAWHDFGQANQVRGNSNVGTNYFDICDRATGGDAPCAKAAAEGIRSVLAGETSFTLEYPCHSPTQQRWFQLRATRLEHEETTYAVVAHHDITDRILIEQERQGLLAKAHRYQEQLKALAATSTRLVAAGSPETIFEEVTEQARLIVGAHWASTHVVPYVLWPSHPIIVSVSDKYRELSASVIAQSGVGIYTYVVQSGLSLRLTEIELNQHPELEGVRTKDVDLLVPRGILAVPIPGPGGGALGALMLSDKYHGKFTPDDEAILVQLTQIASVSLESAVQARAERESRERLWATHEHAGVGIGETNAAGMFVTVNRGLTAITGYSRKELLAMSMFDLTPSENAEAERNLYDRQIAGELETYTLEGRHLRKDGSSAWLNVSSTAVFGERGQFQYSVRVFQDIDQRKRFERRQALLVRELHHRVRNTLAVVEALAGATARTTASIRDFSRSFSTRIAAMARAQTLLSENYWQTASLREMLLSELQPFGGKKRQRYKLEGPEVNLASDVAIPLSMALHELTANAARYGALSVRKGSVAVTWDVVASDGLRILRLMWLERNGPPVDKPTHSGVGSNLLQRVLTAQCQAQVRLDFDPAGLQFEVEVPLTAHRRAFEQ